MKKKLLAIFLIVCVLAITISTTSLAYFTDTKDIENTFAVGDVTIKLDEAKVQVVDKHAQLVAGQRTEENQSYGNLYPGFTITKDPTITNTGSEKAYVGAKVVISTTNGITDANKHCFENLLKGGLLADTTNATVSKRINANTYEIYIVYNAELANSLSVKLFETLSVSNDYDNAKMEQMEGMKITVTAYAVQSVGMTDALSALQAAFDVFDHIPSN